MQSYKHFTLDERECLAEFLKAGLSMSNIAKKLNRNKSSISRELNRNSDSIGYYRPIYAERSYYLKRKASVKKPRLDDIKLRDYVVEKLQLFWSPEAIVALYKRQNPNTKLSHSTLYMAIKKRKLPHIEPKTHLRRRGGTKKGQKFQTIKPTRTIHDRPQAIKDRLRLGDLEGDSLRGGIGKGSLLTLVDRKSRMLYADNRKTNYSEEVKQSIMRTVKGKNILSITFDRGSEFAKFAEVEAETGIPIYFADPHSPWQRPTNENTNGILRFFFPKGTNFHKVTPKQLQHVVDLINNRPKKCLNWLSPMQFHNNKSLHLN